MAIALGQAIAPVQFENIPEELKQHNNWLLWKAIPSKKDENKLDKIPVDINGYGINFMDPSNYLSFVEVEEAFKKGSFDGVGFSMVNNDFIVIDWDDIEDMSNLPKELKQLLVLGYAETSPSGTGYHIWLHGQKPSKMGRIGRTSDGKKIEVFSNTGWLTMTGTNVNGQPIHFNNQYVIDMLHDRYFKKKKDSSTNTIAAIDNGMDLDSIKQAMFKSNKILSLWNGDLSSHNGDNSAADQALCNHLAFYTGKDPIKMDQLFRQSALMRSKWDRKTGNSTYGEMTIQKAMDGTSNVYKPRNEGYKLNVSDIAEIQKEGASSNAQPTLEETPSTDNKVIPIISQIRDGFQLHWDDYDTYLNWKSQAQQKGDWRANLEYKTNKKKEYAAIKSCARNVELILEKELGNKLALNTFSMDSVLKDNLPWREADENEWKSYDHNQLEHWFETKWDIKGKDMINNALIHIVHKRSFHPIKEKIESVEWDGEIRVPTLFCDYLGAENTTYVHEITTRWLVGGVARIYKPGCKFEIVPILTGEKGLGKSTLGNKLSFGEWFTDSLRSLDPKVAGEIFAGIWICEFPEMKVFKGVSDEEKKAFISSESDTYRGAYERGKATRHKRHTILFGTSNKHDVLTDETGERRQFPIKCSKAKRIRNVFEDLTEEEVLQIWAEAKYYYDNDYPIFIDDAIQQLAEEIFKNHRDVDPLEGEVAEYVENHGAVCVRQVWEDVMADDPKKKPTRKDSNRIVSILTALGYEHIGSKRFEKYGKQKIYGTNRN